MSQLISYLMVSHYWKIYKAWCPSWYLISWSAITGRFTRHDAPADILFHGLSLLEDLQGMMPKLISYLMVSHYCYIYKPWYPGWYLISWSAITVRFTRHEAPADILSHGQPLLLDLQGMMSQLIFYLMVSHYCKIYKAWCSSWYLISWSVITGRFTRHDAQADILSHGQPLLLHLRAMIPRLISYLMVCHYCQIYKAWCPSWYLISWSAITVRFTRHEAPADILSHGQPLLEDLQGMMLQLISYLVVSHYWKIYKAWCPSWYLISWSAITVTFTSHDTPADILSHGLPLLSDLQGMRPQLISYLMVSHYWKIYKAWCSSWYLISWSVITGRFTRHDAQADILSHSQPLLLHLLAMIPWLISYLMVCHYCQIYKAWGPSWYLISWSAITVTFTRHDVPADILSHGQPLL